MRHGRCFTGPPLLAALLICAGCEIREQVPAEQQRGQAGLAGLEEQLGDRGGEAGLAQGRIDFVDGFERGVQQARQRQKPMLLFFTAQWCKYCRQMADETLSQTAVVELSRQFVCVLIDADAEPRVCREFEVRSFPTVQFVSAGGVRLHRAIGKQPAEQLIAQMRAALETLARRPEFTLQR